MHKGINVSSILPNVFRQGRTSGTDFPMTNIFRRFVEVSRTDNLMPVEISTRTSRFSIETALALPEPVLLIVNPPGKGSASVGTSIFSDKYGRPLTEDESTTPSKEEKKFVKMVSEGEIISFKKAWIAPVKFSKELSDLDLSQGKFWGRTSVSKVLAIVKAKATGGMYAKKFDPRVILSKYVFRIVCPFSGTIFAVPMSYYPGSSNRVIDDFFDAKSLGVRVMGNKTIGKFPYFSTAFCFAYFSHLISGKGGVDDEPGSADYADAYNLLSGEPFTLDKFVAEANMYVRWFETLRVRIKIDKWVGSSVADEIASLSKVADIASVIYDDEEGFKEDRELSMQAGVVDFSAAMLDVERDEEEIMMRSIARKKAAMESRKAFAEEQRKIKRSNVIELILEEDSRASSGLESTDDSPGDDPDSSIDYGDYSDDA
jgi:hypothetical protein